MPSIGDRIREIREASDGTALTSGKIHVLAKRVGDTTYGLLIPIDRAGV